MLKRPDSLLMIVILVVVSLLAACGGGEKSEAGSSQAGEGDPQRGKALYDQTVIGVSSAPGCAACHSRDPGKVLVGPSHADVGARAAAAAPGKSAEEYLREAIVSPDAHVAEGFPPGIMYKNYSQDLTEQEINDLVSYMLTLK
jgi:cytochrome c551/c552